VFDVTLHAADDPVIWEHARQNIAVLISKDEDFVDRWLMRRLRMLISLC
jgi:predicted nuclease of predicted toxin-antitoxin system